MRRLAVVLLAAEAAALVLVAGVHALGDGAARGGALHAGLLIADAALLVLAALALARRWPGVTWGAVAVVSANVVATLADDVGPADVAFLAALVTLVVLLGLAIRPSADS